MVFKLILLAYVGMNESDCSSSPEEEDELPLDTDSEEIWNNDDNEAMCEFLEEAPPLPQESSEPEHSKQNSLILWFTGFLLLFQARHYVSDAAMNILLKFMRIFFCVLSRFSTFLPPLAHGIPSSIGNLRSKSHKVTFRKYVVCPSCHRLYCHENVSYEVDLNSSAKCPFICFPNHLQRKNIGLLVAILSLKLFGTFQEKYFCTFIRFILTIVSSQA